MRWSLSCLLLALAVCGAGSAWAEEWQDCAPYRVDWTFRAASPIAPPIAVDPEGRVFMATHEGSVHGVAADGRFLWSYTVSGALVNGVTLDSTGRLYTSSSDARFWSFSKEGEARWVFQAPIRAESPLVLSPKHAAMFVTGQSLHAVSSKGGLLWGMPLRGELVGTPVAGPSGDTWLSTDEGFLYAIETPFRQQRWKLSERSLRLLAVGRRFALVADERRASCVDRAGQIAWSIEGVQWASVEARGGELAVLIRSGNVEFRDLPTGRVVATLPYAAPLSAPPLLVGSTAFLPRADGRLDVVENGVDPSSCRLADAALQTPVLSLDRVIVAAGSGVVAALALPGATR